MTDARASFSNFGTCVDLFAPGQVVTGPWATSDTATNTLSSTAFAAADVAGVVALWRQLNPSWTPAQLSAALASSATVNVITNPGTGSPNRLLYTRMS
jgi:subtilisin family serine protease